MRVRFAPSPTGALHIGGARTALFNWLLARGHDAEFVLRIEDTDRERSTPENVEQIFDALRWLELDWDGEPVFQSRRADRHAEVVEQLLDAGHAYRSTAGPDDVRAYKEAHGNRGYRGEDEGTGAVRLRAPDEGVTTVVDVVRGETQFENALQDDLVIARADGTPVYHLAVVVDDHDAGITHVVRGADHYSNTPKHVLIQHAMGIETPVYAHLPLLHGPDGKKLSKRHGAASVQELRERGYLPEAVRNYLALLGWGYDDETTFFTTDGADPPLLARARLEEPRGVRRGQAALDERPLPARAAARRSHRGGWRSSRGGRGLRDAVAVTQEKISTLDEFWPLARSFFDEPVDDPAAREKFLAPEAGAAGAHRRPRRARRGAGPLEHRERRAGAARRGRAQRDEGQAGVPAAARRVDGEHGLARHLRNRRARRPRPRAGADRRGARPPPWRLIHNGPG